MSERDWQLTWWTCRVRPPAEMHSNICHQVVEPGNDKCLKMESSLQVKLHSIVKYVLHICSGSIWDKPGRRKAAGANTSTAEEPRSWRKAAEASVLLLLPPLPPSLSSSSHCLPQLPFQLQDSGALAFPGGRRWRRACRCQSRLAPGSAVKQHGSGLLWTYGRLTLQKTYSKSIVLIKNLCKIIYSLSSKWWMSVKFMRRSLVNSVIKVESGTEEPAFVI